MNNSGSLSAEQLQQVIHRFEAIVGSEGVTVGADDLKRYGRDWIADYPPNPSAVLFPRSTREVSETIKVCAELGIAVVPSGGRTGLSGGATAVAGEVIISLEKMNRIDQINPIDRTVRCGAGVITQKLQDAARERDLYFPVDFSSKGSSQIGGNIATNAGGIRVLRYGNMREWILGLTAVTGTGEILELNGALIKNQTGYDLKSLLIGSEGTLAIITEAVIKLTAPPGEYVRVLCGLASISDLLPFFQAIRGAFRELSAFEYLSDRALEQVMVHHRLPNPLQGTYPAYVVVEMECGSEALRDRIEQEFSAHLESGLIADAVISQSSKQADDLLKYRELISETLSTHYTIHKNDVAVPIPAVTDFITDLEGEIRAAYPDFNVIVFGHVGDGNLHVNVLKPAAMECDKFFEHCKEADRLLFSLVQRHRGSISAEHGVGLLKREFLGFSRTAAEIALMRGIKQVLDPKGILNPGKIFTTGPSAA